MEQLSDILFLEEFDLFYELGFQRQTALSPSFQMPVRVERTLFFSSYLVVIVFGNISSPVGPIQ